MTHRNHIPLAAPRRPRFGVLASLAASATLLMSTSLTAAAVLLDNTSNGTAAFASSGSDLTSLLTKQGLEFSIGAGHTFSLSSLKLGLAGLTPTAPSFTVELWNSGGASVLGSQSFTASAATTGYYDFTLTQIAFSNLSAGNYYLTVSSTNTYWYNLSPTATPTSPTTGFSFVGYRRSTNNGATWGSTGNQNSIFLQGTVNAAGVPGSGLAAIGTLGVAGVARRRRR